MAGKHERGNADAWLKDKRGEEEAKLSLNEK
jgi:hypothetical protein